MKIDKLKIDFSKRGLSIFFKPYQVEALRFLLEETEGSSLDVYQHILLVADIMISRASVINTLNKWVEWDLLGYREDTGKGGIRRIYHINELLLNEQHIIRWLYAHMVHKMSAEGIK